MHRRIEVLWESGSLFVQHFPIGIHRLGVAAGNASGSGSSPGRRARPAPCGPGRPARPRSWRPRPGAASPFLAGRSTCETTLKTMFSWLNEKIPRAWSPCVQAQASEERCREGHEHGLLAVIHVNSGRACWPRPPAGSRGRSRGDRLPDAGRGRPRGGRRPVPAKAARLVGDRRACSPPRNPSAAIASGLSFRTTMRSSMIGRSAGSVKACSMARPPPFPPSVPRTVSPSPLTEIAGRIGPSTSSPLARANACRTNDAAIDARPVGHRHLQCQVVQSRQWTAPASQRHGQAIGGIGQLAAVAVVPHRRNAERRSGKTEERNCKPLHKFTHHGKFLTRC